MIACLFYIGAALGALIVAGAICDAICYFLP
jgi:hypothetical protein